MRLYNQNSRNPIQSTGSLDSKKWIRPKTYLPDQYQVADSLANRSNNESRNDIDDRELTETNFLFDIDEEISMTSSSTLSTHTTFQQDQHDGCRLGLAKPFPGFQKPAKTPDGQDENPFEVLRTTTAHKKKPYRSKPVRLDQVCTLKTSKKGCTNQDENLFSVPEMTLTDSSSEESPWQDFPSGSFSSNPFRAEEESQASNKAKQNAALKFSMIEKDTSMKTKEPGSGARKCDSAKYSGMMIRGLSVAEVAKIMAQDQVDPSIISLVMIAASDTC